MPSLHEWQKKLESMDPSKIELGLDRVKSVFDLLGIHFRGKVILVAGTNGKGSTVAALEALLLRQGATVGAYTSPHLQRFNERARYNGHAALDDELVSAFNYVESKKGKIPLTYFEFTTLAVMWYFAEKNPDYMIYEVGLGGRLDAVNVLDADIAVITGVALDHTDWLGPNEEFIGYEKAGIYRSGRPAVFAGKEIPNTVKERISELDSIPFLRGEQIHCDDLDGCFMFQVRDAQGHNQQLEIPHPRLPKDSILAALTAYRLLGFDLTPETSKILASVELPGRYQHAMLGNLSLVLDVAHNPQAANYLAANLRRDRGLSDKPDAIVGVMRDKPFGQMFESLCPEIQDWYLVVPDIPRAASTEKIRRELIKLNVSPDCIHEVGKVANLKSMLDTMAAAVVFGSFYTVGEFLDHFGDQIE